MDKKSYIRIRVSNEAKRELKQTALDQDTSMSQIVRNRLRNV